MDQSIPTVAIGGINAGNAQRVIFQSKSLSKGLDGVAVVSALMSAEDPGAAATALRRSIQEVPESIRALVINMGTVTPDGISNYITALKAYNEIGGPVLFDPVGAGATSIRRNAVKTLMSSGYFHVIKGNENEIKTVLGESTNQQKGVDSGGSTSDEREKVRVVNTLAARERNVVLMTGEIDYLSDGERTYTINNGHPYLGSITGSGCTVGTTIASFLAVHREDVLLAAMAGILMYEIAAERAALREDVKGPGTFVPAFLDQLYLLAADASQDDHEWLKAAKVKKL